jgi:hypothetical protein
LNGDGYISREELRKMFQAYFALSMDLVRVSVKVMEEDMLANFDDDGTKPVSAAFGAPSTLNDSSHRQETELSQKQPESSEILSIADRLEDDGMEAELSDVSIPNKRRVSFDLPTASPTTYDLRPSLPYMRDEDHVPIVETISQDAIEEMVQQVFLVAGCEKQGKLTLEDFKTVVEYDANILSWYNSFM